MGFKNLLYEKGDGVGIVTLNRPQALNATNLEVIEELNLLFDEIVNDKEVRAVVVTGGTKVFAAGGDVKYMSEASPIEMEDFIGKCHSIQDKVAFSDKPVIAAIAGMALGGGCELALSCDIRIAAETAKFGQPEINLGIIPGAGGTQRLTRLVGPGWARYLIMTGRVINANQALNIGLINEVVPVDELIPRAKKLAAELAAKSPVAMRMAKSCMNMAGNVDLPSGLLFEQKVWSFLFSSEDQKEGMNAFLEKRKPCFIGK